jgi:hypothetical protein
MNPPRATGQARPEPCRPAPDHRFLRRPPAGAAQLDRPAVTADRAQRASSCCALRPHLSTEDVALGYEQLLQVAVGWRDPQAKLHPDLRPMFHHLEERIRRHVLLCWLALLLTRIAENATSDTWRNLRRELHSSPRSAGTAPTRPAGILASFRERDYPRARGCNQVSEAVSRVSQLVSSASTAARGTRTRRPNRIVGKVPFAAHR